MGRLGVSYSFWVLQRDFESFEKYLVLAPYILSLPPPIPPSLPSSLPSSLRYARGKTLKEEALAKYKVNSRASIVTMLQEGKGVMPKYGSYTRKNGDVVPAKLSEQEMGVVADYVLEQAKAGWK